MTILYSVIARGETILCSHTATGGNFDEVALSMLPNIPTRNDARTTYTSHNYLFHVAVENGIIYLCSSEADSGRRQPYAFLSEIKKQLISMDLFSRLQFATEWDLQSDFAGVLASQMEKFSRPESDKLTALQSQVDEVKDIMTQNIEDVLRRGENLDTLMDKTEDLEASSSTFRKTARRVSRKMWWRNTKMTILLVVVGLVVVTVIVLIILYAVGVFDHKDSGSHTTLPPTTTHHQ